MQTNSNICTPCDIVDVRVRVVLQEVVLLFVVIVVIIQQDEGLVLLDVRLKEGEGRMRDIRILNQLPRHFHSSACLLAPYCDAFVGFEGQQHDCGDGGQVGVQALWAHGGHSRVQTVPAEGSANRRTTACVHNYAFT